MSITLRSAGFNNLRTCSDSRDVPALLAEGLYSLVLLDLSMPHLSGHEIITKTAPLEGRPPIVIVTASSHIRDYADGAAGGAVDYLVKPIDRERLLAVVRRALDRPAGSHRARLTRSYLLSDRITAGSRHTESQGIIDMLEQARREYRNLIGTLPIPYVLLEEESFRIRYSNDAFRRFLGPSDDPVAAHRELAEPQDFFRMFEPQAREQLISVLRENGELRDVELSGRTPEGRSFTIIGSFRASPDDNSIEGGFVDVTGRKTLEAELARTGRLHAIGRLAAGFAHDFNNILLVVSGFAEMIASETGVSAEVSAEVQQIRLAVSKAQRIVRQLLSPGNPSREAHACLDLNAALREAESSLRQHLRPGQELQLICGAADPLVDLTAAQVDQVVRNLVMNAADAMPAGTITVSTAPGPAGHTVGPGKSVLLEIRDTGIGMDATTTARIFEPFFTTKPEGKGTGLGLPMVQHIIETVGGSIRVESAPELGTLFSIQLPRSHGGANCGEDAPPKTETGGHN
jgi:hypothetical protein